MLVLEKGSRFLEWVLYVWMLQLHALASVLKRSSNGKGVSCMDGSVACCCIKRWHQCSNGGIAGKEEEEMCVSAS